MSVLQQKMLRAREVRINTGPNKQHTIIARRPTPIEREEKFKSGNPSRAVLSLVVGWEGVNESDLIPGGDPLPVPFDAAACEEWLSDRPDLFADVVSGIVEAYEEYARRLDETLGN